MSLREKLSCHGAPSASLGSRLCEVTFCTSVKHSSIRNCSTNPCENAHIEPPVAHQPPPIALHDQGTMPSNWLGHSNSPGERRMTRQESLLEQAALVSMSDPEASPSSFSMHEPFGEDDLRDDVALIVSPARNPFDRAQTHDDDDEPVPVRQAGTWLWHRLAFEWTSCFSLFDRQLDKIDMKRCKRYARSGKGGGSLCARARGGDRRRPVVCPFTCPLRSLTSIAARTCGHASDATTRASRRSPRGCACSCTSTCALRYTPLLCFASLLPLPQTRVVRHQQIPLTMNAGGTVAGVPHGVLPQLPQELVVLHTGGCGQAGGGGAQRAHGGVSHAGAVPALANLPTRQ
jgi:hypothetical protein